MTDCVRGIAMMTSASVFRTRIIPVGTIVLAIIIEEGLHGSTAARAATKMMERYLKTRLTMTAIVND